MNVPSRVHSVSALARALEQVRTIQIVLGVGRSWAGVTDGGTSQSIGL